jgi:hypothetical protein
LQAIPLDLLRDQSELHDQQPGPDQQPEPQKQPLHLISDNLTRWNSWYDAAVRAIELRHVVDEFIDSELVEYHKRLVRHERLLHANPLLQKEPPKSPLLLEDRLSPKDWSTIVTYITTLKLCKEATMKLQGNIGTTSKHTKAVKGAIWQVLPTFG